MLCAFASSLHNSFVTNTAMFNTNSLILISYLYSSIISRFTFRYKKGSLLARISGFGEAKFGSFKVFTLQQNRFEYEQFLSKKQKLLVGMYSNFRFAYLEIFDGGLFEKIIVHNSNRFQIFKNMYRFSLTFEKN